MSKDSCDGGRNLPFIFFVVIVAVMLLAALWWL